MTTASTPSLSEQALELLSHGTGLGDIMGYGDTEYEAMYALGHNHYSQERYLDAAKCFGFLVAHNTMERRYLSAYASTLQMLKRYREAIQYHSVASVMDLEDPLPTFHTAECFLALEMHEEARQALDLVLAQCDKPHWHVLRQRCEALLALLADAVSDSSRSQAKEGPQ
ncbi:SycD/LcrH family type III secretion system chaperone [Comamonas antarctica]|uniref:SycD/LcrH family type III secretion system chaperone n=1 Tax=Comamonas antarctica TaxID=2743470 RepID=A0A6N1X945_9BURK|nr:SycD/LcrH family type III secretion system chaperone [Comamonas antarctica]QKV54380.1 SycD/LcrH family type III secretion system chaperone [Comamonas antarctica]